MKRGDVRILVVDDDPTFGKAVTEALSRAGYTTRLEANYLKAKQAVKITDFHAFVIDCMLPQKSGVDLAAELLREVSPDTPIVLTSGIFKDRAFSIDAIRQTGAIAFLNKPFDMEELVGVLDEAFKSRLGEDRPPLYQLVSKTLVSPAERIEAIKNTRFIHGLDLPLVFSTLINTPISGELSIKFDDGKTAHLQFYKGRMANLNYQDSESYFGVLLIEMGFTSAEELEEGLSQTLSKPIGQRLVDASALSPHAVQIVHHEQMIIRLSKIIRDGSVEIEFNEKEIEEPESHVDGLEFTQLMSDWILSKMPREWLRSFYTPWLENPLIKGPDYAKYQMAKGLPVLMPVQDVFGENLNGQNLEDFLGCYPERETEVLRGLHFLLLEKAYVFAAQREETKNMHLKLERLKKVWTEMREQDFFAVLGVSRTARPAEISRSFHELAKTLHPDKLPRSAPQEMKDLAQSIFAKITDAYQTLSNETKRGHYKKTLEMGAAEEILKSESSFEEAQRMLQANRYREARKTFEKTIKMRGHRSDTIVYLIWALLKEKRNRSDHSKLANHVVSLFSQVAHEDRHSPQYFFAKGMFYEVSGQLSKATNAFKHCLVLDPNFIDARRELAFIKQNYSKQKNNSFSDDLSIAVTKFFRKKSS